MTTTLTAGGPVDHLLTDLRQRVPGQWSGPGRELLTEIRDGLEDTTAAYREAGMSATEAEHRAVEDFGDVDRVAVLCREQVGASGGFRSAVVVTIAFPLMLACWGVYYLFFQHARTVDAHLMQAVVTDYRAVETVAGLVADKDAAGVLISNGFTIIGVATAGIALLTLCWLRVHSRVGAQSPRPVVVAFAVATLMAVLLTYLLSAVTASRPDRASAEVFAERVVQGISLLLTAVSTWAACLALRLNLDRRTRPLGTVHRSNPGPSCPSVSVD